MKLQKAMKVTLNVLLLIGMVIGGFSSSIANAQTSAQNPQVVDKGLNATIEPVYTEGSLKNAIQMDDGRYSVIVQLEQAPLATYRGGIQGLAGTSPQATGRAKLDVNTPESQAYIQYLIDVQAQFTQQLSTVAPSATVAYSYQVAFNGISMKVAREDISRIALMPGVVKVYPDQVRYVEMDASLPLIKASAMWTKLGGQSNAGKGIKIADVDTGLDIVNPMFSDTGFEAPPGYPKGYCVTNPADPNFHCNEKVIAARFFYDPGLVGGSTVLDPNEVMSPLGINGHGTHTAGTMAGNSVSTTVNGINFDISGVAPAAYLMVYKGLFAVIRSGEKVGSGTDTMLVASLDAALSDGADVINNSWGGGVGDPNSSIYKSLIGAITEAGTLVVFSAGNSGPNSGTIGCPGCVEDALTVAASTTNRILANQFDITGPTPVPANLTGLGAFSSGKALTADLSAPIRYLATDADGCAAFPANYFQTAIALVFRGTCTFATKVTNAVTAGAVAVVIVNNAGGPPVGMAGVGTTTPSFMIDMINGKAVRDFITTSTAPVTATIGATTVKINNNAYQDVMAGFSSVGPDGDPNVLKPDITAPGVNILSSSSPVLVPGAVEPFFQFMQGTSMAAPHITGSAALVMQQHPDWTPWQVRTALTSTAVRTLVKPDGVTPANPFNMGSGRVDLERASNAALTFNKSSLTNSNCLVSCSWTIELKNVTDSEGTWNAVTTSSNTSLDLDVSPSSVTLPAGASIEVEVTADVSQVTTGTYYFGSLTFAQQAPATSPDAYIPITVRSGTATSAAVFTETVNKATATSGDELTYTLKVTNLTPAETTFTVQSTLNPNLVYKDGSATGGLTYDDDTRTLTGEATLDPFVMDVVPTGTATKYIAGNPAYSLDLTANCPTADPTCDEVVFRITGVDFYYLGVHNTELKISSNGFIVAGTASSSSAATPQALPNPATPNNVIAPLWSDLDFAYPGAKWLIWGTATDTVFEWQNANAYGNTSIRYNFEIWIKDGTNEITFAYGPLNADVGAASPVYAYSVGAENSDGSAGDSYYFNNGTVSGTAPVTGTDLKVVNDLFSATMTFKANINLIDFSNPVINNEAQAYNNYDSKVYTAVAYTLVSGLKTFLPLLVK